MTQNSEDKKKGMPGKATPVPWSPVSAQRQPLFPDSCLSIEGIPVNAYVAFLVGCMLSVKSGLLI